MTVDAVASREYLGKAGYTEACLRNCQIFVMMAGHIGRWLKIRENGIMRIERIGSMIVFYL